MPTSGTNSAASRNSTPVTTEAKPVRPPCSIPAADSIYEVVVDVPQTAPNMVAAASIISSRSSFSMLPFSSTRPAGGATASRVPMLSNISINISVKTAENMLHFSAPRISILNSVGAMFRLNSTIFSGRGIWPNAAATTVEKAMPISRAPGTRHISRTIITASPASPNRIVGVMWALVTSVSG